MIRTMDEQHYLLLHELNQLLSSQVTTTIHELIKNAKQAQQYQSAQYQSNLEHLNLTDCLLKPDEKWQVFCKVCRDFECRVLLSEQGSMAIEPTVAGIFFASCLRTAYAKAQHEKQQQSLQLKAASKQAQQHQQKKQQQQKERTVRDKSAKATRTSKTAKELKQHQHFDPKYEWCYPLNIANSDPNKFGVV